MIDLSDILNHLGEDRASYQGSVVPPIFQTSMFAFESVAKFRESLKDELNNPFYTRGHNPTTAILRKKLAALEGADDCLVFASGSAAIAAACKGPRCAVRSTLIDAASLTIGAPPVLQQTAARTVSWNAVNGATRYEIWVDSLGGASQPGAQVVHETTWRRTTYSLNRSLPAGEYRVWVRAIRTERREVYRSAWSASLTIQVADVAANGHSDALSFLPAPLVRPMLSSIANAGLQYPDAGRDPVRVNPDSHPSVSTQESMEVPIPGAFVVAQVREHEARLIDLAVTGSLAWLS